jgi:hypothetical protein
MKQKYLGGKLMFPDMNKIMNADLTGVEIELPEEIGEKAMEIAMKAAELEMELIAYLYGSEPTEEQITEAATILALYLVKRIDEVTNPEIED